ncbi:hypothetical protein AB1Y20_000341 [Prymnesium parvum]|uniref:Uncharacterized protein n=1 Tax=Prymnesium parvum TaxID=97485 RepID=A0AB34K9T7_PRYPA
MSDEERDDGEEGESWDDGEEESDLFHRGRPYVPPAAGEGEKVRFGDNVDPSFIVPQRLRDKPYELIEAANDWHYAMMNDHPRNEFYMSALRRVITPGSVVLEIGAGSGLLSIIAASLGAKCVVAIEANHHLARVAQEIVRRNGFESKVHIINKMSTDVSADELTQFGRPTILLSEILGTLMLGESALHYVQDARTRLMSPRSAIVPARGRQFATLIESQDIESITSVKSWRGIDLGWFNTLQDTTSMIFTKQYGFRFSSCAYKTLAPKQQVLDVDFSCAVVGMWRGERRQAIQATQSGTVHAIMASWEVYDGEKEEFVMSTHPDATLNNFPRDMQWGQGLQLIEDMSQETDAPIPFKVTQGEWLILVTRFSIDGVTLQFQIERAASAA